MTSIVRPEPRPSGFVSTKDLHSEEVKVRLKEKDLALLEAIAIREDVPLAVVARRLIVQHLSRTQSEQKAVAS